MQVTKILLCTFRDEEKDLKLEGFYSKTLNEPDVLNVVNENKKLFQLNAELV